MESTMVTDTEIGTKWNLAWLVTLTASLLFFYSFVQLNIFNAIDQELMQAFHLDALELGELGSIFFYANALFLLPAGVLLDRFSTKKIMLISLSFMTIGTFLFSIATSYGLAAVGRVFIGGASAFSFLSGIRLASRWFPPQKMALVSGVMVTMAMIGGLVAQTPMALLTNYMGWRHAMLLDAGLGLVIFAAIFLLVKDYPPHAADKQKEDQANIKNLGLWKGLQLVFLNPQNWFGGIYTALMNLPVFLLGAIWGIHYLTEVHHVTVLQASYVTTFFFIGVIFGAPFFGWLSDYMSRRIFPMTLGAIMSLIVILLIIFMPYLSLKELMLLFFLIGFVTSSQVLSYPTIAELNSPILTSSAISIVSITIMASGVIFQPLFGWLMELGWDHTIVDNVPIYSASNFLHAMLIMPCAFIIGFFIAFMIKETYCRAKG